MNLYPAEPLVPTELEDQANLPQVPEPRDITAHAEADTLKLPSPNLDPTFQVAPPASHYLHRGETGAGKEEAGLGIPHPKGG